MLSSASIQGTLTRGRAVTFAFSTSNYYHSCQLSLGHMRLTHPLDGDGESPDALPALCIYPDLLYSSYA